MPNCKNKQFLSSIFRTHPKKKRQLSCAYEVVLTIANSMTQNVFLINTYFLWQLTESVNFLVAMLINYSAELTG
jgi:hypothetical protein